MQVLGMQAGELSGISQPMAGTKSVDAKDAEKGKKGQRKAGAGQKAGTVAGDPLKFECFLGNLP